METIQEKLAAEFPALDMGKELAYFESVVKREITEPYVPAFRAFLAKRVQVVANTKPAFESGMYGDESLHSGRNTNSENEA